MANENVNSSPITLFEKYYLNLGASLLLMNSNAESKDAKSNNLNYGKACVYAEILKDMGHKVELNVYVNDSKYLVTDKWKLDGREHNNV